MENCPILVARKENKLDLENERKLGLIKFCLVRN